MAWVICPYDTSQRRGLGKFSRIPSMRRYIRTSPRPDGAVWSEVEILGNHILVKVSAPTSLIDTIIADVDFLEIPARIQGRVRSEIRTKLNTLGYSDAELDATGWDQSALLRHLAITGRNNVVKNEAGDGLEILSTRRLPSKTFEDIEREVG